MADRFMLIVITVCTIALGSITSLLIYSMVTTPNPKPNPTITTTTPQTPEVIFANKGYFCSQYDDNVAKCVRYLKLPTK